jgi:hypothetical protein
MSDPVQPYFDRFTNDPASEAAIYEDATDDLSSEQMAKLRERIQKKKDKVQKKIAKAESTVVPTPGTSVAAGTETKSMGTEITASQMESFWQQIEAMDPSDLISQDVLDAFKYIGYNPEVVLKTMLLRGGGKGKTQREILKDLMDICTIAIIKGSVTENNLKKTSDNGKAAYRALQDVYDLKNGGAKGKSSEFLTVARVAAAVPSVIMQVLTKKPDLAKKFPGPFSTTSLPPYLRHQSAAACIPEDLPERLKQYLLGLITAYTADQSKALSKTKDSPEVLFDTQQAFVLTTFNSEHPTLPKRKAIFSQFSISADYDKLNAVAIKVKKVKTDFEILTQAQIDEDLAK